MTNAHARMMTGGMLVLAGAIVFAGAKADEAAFGFVLGAIGLLMVGHECHQTGKQDRREQADAPPDES
jgi:hypothetical protein